MSDLSMARLAEKSGREKKGDVKTRIVVTLFVILCAIFLIEIGAYKFVLPSMETPKVIVNGGSRITPEEIAARLSPMRGANWFSFNAEEAASILASIPSVSSASVSKRFPDKIFINITERTGVAMTFVQANGRSVLLQIDGDGVLFDGGGLGQSGALPIVSGIPVERLSEGMRIPARYHELIRQIADISALGQNYFAAIAEICVIPKEYGTYELMLIPSTARARVITDRALSEDALQYMMVVLDLVDSIEPDVSEIDLRYGAISFVRRGTGEDLI